LARWLDGARARELPRRDPEPLIEAGVQIPLVWRTHYAAAVFDGTPSEVTTSLEDKGFAVFVFPASEDEWGTEFERLTAALGRDS
jgi:hypothetical protein